MKKDDTIVGRYYYIKVRNIIMTVKKCKTAIMATTWAQQ